MLNISHEFRMIFKKKVNYNYFFFCNYCHSSCFTLKEIPKKLFVQFGKIIHYLYFFLTISFYYMVCTSDLVNSVNRPPIISKSYILQLSHLLTNDIKRIIAQLAITFLSEHLIELTLLYSIVFFFGEKLQCSQLMSLHI